jgi:hypothetical protein
MSHGVESRETVLVLKGTSELSALAQGIIVLCTICMAASCSAVDVYRVLHYVVANNTREEAVDPVARATGAQQMLHTQNPAESIVTFHL